MTDSMRFFDSMHLADVAPDALVRVLGTGLVDAIAADGAIQAGDRERLFQLVCNNFLPFTDWTTATRITAGRYWRQATPNQHAMFVHEYTQLMLMAYTDALARARGPVEVAPPRLVDADADAIVPTRMATADGGVLALDYRLRRTGHMGWRIYDVRIQGDWFIEAHQQPFAEAVQQNGCAGLADRLRADKERLAARLGIRPY